MPFFPNAFPEETIFLSRNDALNPLASFSKHEFELDGAIWPSVEHYFHGMKFAEGTSLREKIRHAPNPSAAAKIACWNFWRVRRDWKKVQRVIMTRGTYIKCRTHSEVAEALLETGDNPIVENSLYDPYWGCGRDQRGNNFFGKMLMDIRQRLREEQGKEG